MKSTTAKKKAASKKPQSSFRLNLLNSFITLFFLSLSGLVILTAINPSYRSQLRQRKERERLESKFTSLQKKNQAMQEEIGRLQTDDYIECLARKDLGFVKPGESAYVVVTPETGDEFKPVAKPEKKKDRPEPFWQRALVFFDNLLP